MKNQRGSIILAILIGVATAGVLIGGYVGINDYVEGRSASNHAQDAEAKQILKDQLNQFFNNYQDSCFSRVASVGNRQAYLKALDEIVIAYDQNKNLDAQAQYLGNAIYTRQPVKQYDLTNETSRLDLQNTIWHELTHYLEVQNNDRLNWHNVLDPRRNYVKARNERHAEYMTQVLGILQNLKRLEEKAKKNELTAKQAQQQLALLKQQMDSGSSNDFEKVPSDIKEFSKYTGFDVDLNKIFEYYKSGKCLNFPAGSFDNLDQPISEEDFEDNTYVVWEATNASVGICITTKKIYETDELASSYPGGGLDPEKLIKKKLVSGEQSFDTFEAAEKWICDQFSEVWYAPLGIGWTAKWSSRDVFLCNTSCGE